jgi:ribosomal protein S21
MRVVRKKDGVPAALRRFKRRAKQAKKARGVSYQEALEIVAELEGSLDCAEARRIILGRAYAAELAAMNEEDDERTDRPRSAP